MNVDWKKRVHIIIGTDEESDWTCVDRYFKTEEMPELGFAPDAEFPAIHGEKGITTFDIELQGEAKGIEDSNADVTLTAFESGQRYNMVPDEAVAHLKVKSSNSEVTERYQQYLEAHELVGNSELEGDSLVLRLKGKAVHGMDPSIGLNAGLFLLHFLRGLELDAQAAKFVDLSERYLFESHFGKKWV